MSEMGMAMMGTGSAKGDDRAIVAAETAIGSPLLEDINLSGACGILVNVTAGLNLSMREFEEVGRTVGEFASEDATVVVGTVIDPNLQDELRVTVVATGLNRDGQAQEKPMKLVRNASTGEVDYTPTNGATDTATVQNESAIEQPSQSAPAAQEEQLDYLDIPAFLRRQAD